MKIQQLKKFSYNKSDKVYFEDNNTPNYDNMGVQKLEEIRYEDGRRVSSTGKLYSRPEQHKLPQSDVVKSYVFSDFGCMSKEVMDKLVECGFIKVIA